MRCILAFFTLLVISNTQAQTLHNISGSVLDKHKKGVDLAIISLYRLADSSAVKTEFSDQDGSFLLSSIEAGKYFMKIEHQEFKDYSTEFDLSGALNLNPIVLENDEETLGQMTVSGKVPFVERKIDRVVITPEALIASAGTNALEILELAPGVTVDQNGQIVFKGRTGIAVYINDKPSYLSGSELENYLRSLPSGSIQNIELIENPPAKYEAAGNGGIININIKRNTLRGLYGNTSLSYRRSRYNSSHNNLNLNFARKKINLSANVNAGLWENFQDLNINRYYLDNSGNTTSAFRQNSFNNRSGEYLNGRIGMDLYLTDKATFGVSYKKSQSPGERDTDNTSLISDANGDLLQRVVADNLSQTTFGNDLVSLYFTRTLDTLGSEISIDADYVRYVSTNDQVFKNFQYDSNGNLTYNDRIDGAIPSEIDIYAVKTDYSKPLKNGANFSAGLKSAYTQTDNEAIYTNTVAGVTEPDYNLSNRFLYDEWINAAYVNYNGMMGKMQFQLGLRGEATQLKGHQLGNIQSPDSSFTRDYMSLFPTLFLARSLDSAGIHQMNFSYGRRIERPYFQDLNPFISPLDQFTFYTGNPNLLPTFSHNFSLTHTYKNMISTSVSYALIQDGINETLEIQDEIYYSRPGNISSSQFLTFSVNGTFELAKWYTINAYAQASYVTFESQLYTEQLNANGINLFANINNNFKLSNGWKLSLSARGSNDNVYSQLLIKSYWVMDVGVQKSVFKGLGNLRLNVSDPFYTRRGDGVINNLSQTNADWNSKYDSRSVSIAFSMRFGKSNSNKKKHDGSGSDSEQNRVKS